MNIAMNKGGTDTQEMILRGIAERLPGLELDWDVELEPRLATDATMRRPDALVKIRHPEGEIRLLAEIKTRAWPDRENRERVINQLVHQELPGLLLADHVPPNLADRLRRRGVLFLDTAGNAYLRDTGLYIWVTGRRDAIRLKAEREKRRAFQPTGLQLVFTLLCKPGLIEADYRTLADVAGVALGTVQRVMRDLIEEGYVLRLGRFERRLVEPKALLEAWIPAYLHNLRHRLLLERFEATTLAWWRKADLRAYGALWGGEPAAAQYTEFLKPGTLTVYANEIPGRLVVRHRLEKKENGRIDFRKKFWRFDVYDAPAAVPPLLVYADLQALRNTRAFEAADRIRQEYIDGLIEAHRTDHVR